MRPAPNEKSHPSPARPLLVVITGGSDPVGRPAFVPPESLKSAFDVVEVENAEEAARCLREAPAGSVVFSDGVDMTHTLGSLLTGTADVLQHLGEGVAVVDESGAYVWCNDRLAARDESIRRAVAERCRQAIEAFNAEGEVACPLSRRYSLICGESAFELAVSPARVEGKEPPRVRSVIGMLWDISARRQLQQKIDAIDAAGSELMRIEASAISRLNMAERLRLLEEKVIRYARELMSFDNFEVRLLDRDTGRLDLVMAVGITPLKIGEVIYARAEGNGISGLVAATGRSYICTDASRDPLYREGLDNAASSLTVPLRLHDEVIGVFNVESNSPNQFDDHDRQFAEIFGRYVAMAIHILDLMVVERCTTNEQIASNVLGELSVPIEEITRRANELCENEIEDPHMRNGLEQIRAAAAEIRHRVESCARGPRTILAADMELKRDAPDPVMIGRRVLVADDEPEIRNIMQRILSQRGCDVTVCSNGSDTIAAIESGGTKHPFDLIISDIRMEDHNGYEIFHAARTVDDSTPVILMTGFGYDPHHSIIRASQEGLHSLLFKPFKASQLIEIITKALTSESGEPQDRRSATRTRQNSS